MRGRGKVGDEEEERGKGEVFLTLRVSSSMLNT